MEALIEFWGGVGLFSFLVLCMILVAIVVKENDGRIIHIFQSVVIVLLIALFIRGIVVIPV